MPGPRPPWLDRVQFILFYASNPCDAPWSLYVELAKEPVGELVALLLIPDPKEIVETFFQPKGLRSKRHGRKGRRGGKRGQAFLPDVDEMIAERIPGAEEMHARRVGVGTRFVFHGIQAYDRVVWPIVLIDQVTSTLFDTIVGVILSNKADCPLFGRMLREASSGIIQTLFGFHVLGLPDLKYKYNVDSPNQFIAGLDFGSYSCTFSMRAYNGHDGVKTLKLALVKDGDFANPIAVYGPKSIPIDTSIELLVNETVSGPCQLQWYVQATGGTLGFSDASMLILQTGY